MQHIKLGQHPPGRYQLEIRPFDDLWRPIASPRAITFTVLSAHSVSRCVAGDAHCTPQRPRKSSDHASNGEAHNMSSFVDHCPPLTPLVCSLGSLALAFFGFARSSPLSTRTQAASVFVRCSSR